MSHRFVPANLSRRFAAWTARLVAVACIVLLGACAETQNLRGDDRAAIHSVYFDEQVKLPEKPLVLTREQGLSMGIGSAIGGAAGGAIMGAAPVTDPAGTTAYLEKNDIHVDRMLVDALQKAVESRQLFTTTSSCAKADATIHLEISVYGVGYTANMFSHDYRAVLNAKATLTRRDGKVVWVKQVVDTSMNGDRATATRDELYSNPEAMRVQMATITANTAHEMAASLASSR